MLGKAVVKNTRITVELVVKKLSEGVSLEGIIEMYPSLEREDIYACLAYASAVLANEDSLDAA